MIEVSFKEALEIIERYRATGNTTLSKEDAAKILGYCMKTGCDKCELKKHYGKCPIVVSLSSVSVKKIRGD